MRAAGVGDERGAGQRQPGEHRDLARVAGPQLDRRGAMLGCQAQQGERHAPVVVEIALGLEHRARGRQHRGDQVLGRGLARAAGDRDQQPVPLLAVAPPQPHQRGGDVVDHDQRAGLAARGRRVAVVAQRRGRAALEGLLEKGVAVGVAARQRHEQVPGGERAGVDRDAADPGLEPGLARRGVAGHAAHPEVPARELGDLRQREQRGGGAGHHGPALRPASSSAATARSSNGSTWPPMVCVVS